MRVEWLHNNPDDRSGGTFMWDIYDRLERIGSIELSLKAVPLIRSIGSFWHSLRTVRAAKKSLILHGQFGSMVGFFSAFQAASIRILTLRGSDIYWRYGSARNRLSGLIRVVLSWIGCTRSDAIVVMSQAMANRVRSWPLLRNRPIHILVDPAGTIFWPPDVCDLAVSLREYHFTVLIASLADQNPVKRLSIVTEAAALCNAAGLSLHLKMLSGVSREKVRDTIAESDSIALASTHEGWPNIIKEGLLLGRPFVATNVSDLPAFTEVVNASFIVAPRPLDFAMAWVDQIAASLLTPHQIAAELAPFHPDVCALKHHLLYLDQLDRLV